MSNTQRRLKKRRYILNELQRLDDNSLKVLIIHYSSESFYDLPEGATARITSIAVKYVHTGQTQSFSIQKSAEELGRLKNIELYYDEIEKSMLSAFNRFVKSHLDYRWIHWNMRDTYFGFQALTHRSKVLKIKAPQAIPDENKYDLADILKKIYGDEYIDNPRKIKICEKNGISMKDCISGEEEVMSFQNKEFSKVHHSTLRKVNMIHSIYEKMIDKSLKTDTKWWKIYGLKPQGLYESVKDNWVFGILCFLLGSIVVYFGQLGLDKALGL